jgi:hypothetical protein
MAAENWSPPISKTFEQIVYFSTIVTGYQTKKSGQFFSFKKTIVVTLKTFEQIF